jgi:large subunit ribosomal protein L3
MKIFAVKKGMTHYYDDSDKQRVACVLGILETVAAKVERKGDQSLVHFVLPGKKDKTKKPIKGQYPKVASISKIETETIDGEPVEEGSKLTIDDLENSKVISVSSVTKGKGFAGTIKRYGFKRGPKTHGSRNYRKPGSIGDTGPQRVLKGKKMAGRMGLEKRTLHNVKIVRIVKDKKEIWVSGHIPGARKSITVITKND